jgi:hypothetical protein
MWCKVMIVFCIGLGLSTSCTTEKSCTTIGCTDQLSLTLTMADGSAPKFDVNLVVDGKAIACQAPTLGGSTRCGDGVLVASRGSGGDQEVLEIQGAPSSVTVSLAQGGATRLLGTFTPTYESLQPNGPGCEPTCRQSTIVQVVETWP